MLSEKVHQQLAGLLFESQRHQRGYSLGYTKR